MRRIDTLSGLTLVAGLAIALTFPRAALASPIGVWFTEDKGAKVELKQCGAGGALCSKIVWLREPTDSQGKPLTDQRNKNPQLRNRPIIGLEILTGLVPEGQNTWSGQIYNPEDGNTYRATLMLVSQNQIRLKGCAMMGLLCGEKIWSRAQDDAVPQPIRKPGPPATPPSDQQVAEAAPAQQQVAEATPPASSTPEATMPEIAAGEPTISAGPESDTADLSPSAAPAVPETPVASEPVASPEPAAMDAMPAPSNAARDFVSDADVTGSVATLAALPLPSPPAGLSLGAAPSTPMEPNVIATLPGMMAVPDLMDGVSTAAPVAEPPAVSPDSVETPDGEPAPQTELSPDSADPAADQAEIVPLPDQKPPKPAARRAGGQTAQQAATAASPRAGSEWAPTPLPWER